MNKVSFLIVFLAISGTAWAQNGYNYPRPESSLGPSTARPGSTSVGRPGSTGAFPSPSAGGGYQTPGFPAISGSTTPVYSDITGYPLSNKPQTSFPTGTGNTGYQGQSSGLPLRPQSDSEYPSGPQSDTGFPGVQRPSAGFPQRPAGPRPGAQPTAGYPASGQGQTGFAVTGQGSTGTFGSVGPTGSTGVTGTFVSGPGNTQGSQFPAGRPSQFPTGPSAPSGPSFPSGASTGQFSGSGQIGQTGGFGSQGSNDGSYEGGDYSAIPGEPGSDYPIYSEIPQTSFDCNNQQWPGYYADIEAQCQVFHICALNRTFDFLCPNGTIFSQEHLVCVWWNQFDCNSASSLYGNNAYIYDYSQTGQQSQNAGAGYPGDQNSQGPTGSYPGSQGSSTGYPGGPGSSGPSSAYPGSQRPTASYPNTQAPSGPSATFPNIQGPSGPSVGYPSAQGPTSTTAGFPTAQRPSGPSAGYPGSQGSTGPSGAFPNVQLPTGPSAPYPAAQGPSAPLGGFPGTQGPSAPSVGFQPSQRPTFPTQSDTQFPVLPSAQTPNREYLPPKRQ